MNKAALSILFAICFIPPSAWSATFECSRSCKNTSEKGPWHRWAVVSGEIVIGDYKKFRDFLQGLKAPINHLSVASKGGSVMEAILIGSLIRKLLISTRSDFEYYPGEIDWIIGKTRIRPKIPRNFDRKNYCYSACFFILAGGLDKFVLGGNVGVHRPRFDRRYFSNLSLSAAKVKYAEMRMRVEKYMIRMRVPASIRKIVWSTPSSQMSFIKKRGREREHPDWKEFTKLPVETAEWLQAKCGAYEVLKAKHGKYFDEVCSKIPSDRGKLRCSRGSVYYHKMEEILRCRQNQLNLERKKAWANEFGQPK